MKKIRTAYELQNVLDGEMSWRIKEIADIRSATKIARAGSEATLRRAGIALLYAHWEGFIKATARAYVTYVAGQRLRHSELRHCFVAMSLRVQIGDLASIRTARPVIAALEAILGTQDDRANFTGGLFGKKLGNLNSETFINVAHWVGLDVERYSTKWHFIDDRLLGRRNAIAHGRSDGLELDREGFDELVNGVLELLRWFKTDIENAVSTRAFHLPRDPALIPAYADQ